VGFKLILLRLKEREREKQGDEYFVSHVLEAQGWK